jgi:hypothetical protein
MRWLQGTQVLMQRNICVTYRAVPYRFHARSMFREHIDVVDNRVLAKSFT